MIECKGKNCEALYGIGHSLECEAEHEQASHFGAGNRHPESRYKGYTLEPLRRGASVDEKYAWVEGYNSREGRSVLKAANVKLSGSAALSQSPARTMGSASGDRYASWCCQRCGDEIGWIGRAFGRILHHCKTPNVELTGDAVSSRRPC